MKSTAFLPDGPARSGVLPIQHLRKLAMDGAIRSDTTIGGEQFQPNSLDLRLGPKAYRTRCSFLPVNTTTSSLLKDADLVLYEIDLRDGHVLECGQTYLIPLLEELSLPESIHGLTNPKSSTGRLDMLARVVTENGHVFDVVQAGYRGRLYVDLVTRSFPIRVRTGDSLVQLRLLTGKNALVEDRELVELIERYDLIRDQGGVPVSRKSLSVDDGILLTVRLEGKKDDETVGYVSKKSTPVVDFSRRDHPVRAYWNYIPAPKRRSDLLMLQPDEFYIFSSCERVRIPPQLCAEMVAFDVKSGEVRTHYAGFFDTGFGTDGSGAHVVLEVRNRDMPFLLQHGQKLFRLRYFRNLEVPEVTYGQAMHSNYQGQGLRLAKHFSSGTSARLRQLELWTASSSSSPPPSNKSVDLSHSDSEDSSDLLQSETQGASGVPPTLG